LGQKYFKRVRDRLTFWGEHTKCNKINNNSENFKGSKIAARAGWGLRLFAIAHFVLLINFLLPVEDKPMCSQ